MMMIWWWWWLMMMMMMMNILEKTAQITLCWGRPPQSLRVVKTELTLLGGLATACSRPCDQNKRQLKQFSQITFFVAQFFSKSPRLFLRIIDAFNDDWWLSSERVHDKNIRKVIKHFQKTKSLAGASQNSLKIRYFRIFSSHQKNAIPDKNFVSR